MEVLLLYILKFSITIAVFALFYRVVLSQITFYTLNRLYFVTAILGSLLFPFIDIAAIWPGSASREPALWRGIPAVSGIAIDRSAAGEPAGPLTIIVFIVLTGSAILLFRLIAQYISVASLRRNAVLVKHDRGVKLFDPGRRLSPFSFGNAIFINREMYADDELMKIAAHESVHVRDRHTADMLLSEMLCIVNWYNPFAWILRKYMRQNLEFIADETVLSEGFDRKEYQYLLLKSSTGFPFSMVNTFSMRNLKKRIIMMHAIKSSERHLLKFSAILPVLLFVSILFRNNTAAAQTEGPTTLSSETAIHITTDSTVPKPLFILDGKRQPASFDINTIKPDAISSISVWKDGEAIKKFGPSGKNGVIEIRRKK